METPPILKDLCSTIDFNISQEKNYALSISMIDSEGKETVMVISGAYMPQIISVCDEVYTNYVRALDEKGLLRKDEKAGHKERLRKKTKTQKSKSQKINESPSLF